MYANTLNLKYRLIYRTAARSVVKFWIPCNQGRRHRFSSGGDGTSDFITMFGRNLISIGGKKGKIAFQAKSL